MNLKLAALLKSKLFIGCASAMAVVTTVVTVIVATNQPDAYRMIKIFDLMGSATIERSGIGELDAYKEMNLESGDIVDVHEGSTMHLNLDDDKYIQLDGGTRLELIATGTASDSLTTINLMEGTILNEITSPLSEGSSYTVNTPKSTMAVRGTSFVVSVEQNPDGSYMTNLYAFHGVVEVQLIDEEGNPKGETVRVLEDQAVAIMTTQNDATTNDANIDGYSFFVVEDGEDGTYRPVSEGESPVTGFDYNDIPESMLRQALSTNNNNEISLDDVVLQEILNALNGDQSSVSANDTASENEAEEALSNSVSSNHTGNDDTAVSENSVSANSISGNTTPATHPVISQNEVPMTPSENTISENTVSRNTISRNTVSPNTVTTPEETTGDSSDDSSGSSSSTSDNSASDNTASDNTVSENDATYTVTFVGRSGETLASQTVSEGESASAPSVESEVYDNGVFYKFTGWSADYSNVTSDLTVTAQYVIMTHVVTFSARNTSTGLYETLSTQEVNRGAVVTPPSIGTESFTVNGTVYQFSRWDYAGSGISSDTTIRALYTETAATHTVTFSYKDANGNATTATQTVAHGDTVTNAPSPATYTSEDGGTTTQYQCSGWDKDINQTITEDITFTAQYTETPLTHTVTVSWRDASGAAQSTTQTVNHGANRSTVNLPNLTGVEYREEVNGTITVYHYANWSNGAATITESCTIEALYSVASTTHYVYFKYWNADGSAMTTAVRQVAHGDTVTNVPTPSNYTYNGSTYYWEGWTSELGSGTAYNITSSVTFTASYISY